MVRITLRRVVIIGSIYKKYNYNLSKFPKGHSTNRAAHCAVLYGPDGPVPVPLSVWLANKTDGRWAGITRLMLPKVWPSQRWMVLDGRFPSLFNCSNTVILLWKICTNNEMHAFKNRSCIVQDGQLGSHDLVETAKMTEPFSSA